jgi:signal transduction histidine kinase/CheY-like chemotaxis protein/HAMP domain-containing protein
VSLLSRLFLLVAVALLPAIAIQTYNEFDLRRSRQIHAQNQALRLATLAAAQQQQIIQGIKQVLIALSELPAIKTKNAQACNAYFSALKQRYPAFLTLAAADINGLFFCDTTTNHSPISAAGRAYFANALTSGGFTVGKFVVGAASGRKIIPFALPFYSDDGHIEGVVLASLSLDWLADYIAQMRMPPGAAVAVTDRDGTYLARYPDNDRFVGRKMPGHQLWSADQLGTAEVRDLNGVERIVGYSALRGDSGALFVTVGLDKAQVFTEIWYRTRRGILLIVLSSTFVLLQTWLGARKFIQSPLERLVYAANQWRLGDYSSRVEIHDKQSEITRASEAFNAMADALEDRERELFKAKETAEEAAARIITFFESTTDAILIVDRDWHITYLNGRAKAQLSDGRDLIGKNLWEAFPDAVGTDPYVQCRQAMSYRHPTTCEWFSPPRNAWSEVNAFPSSQGLVVYLRDITEHKRALEAHRHMEEQLHQSQKMEAVGQLIGGVAHDFNNLLTVVAGNLAFIEECAADNDRVKHFAAAAWQAADRGAKLTAQLLSFSRLQRLNPKTVYADQLIREFEGLIRRAMGDGCELQWNSQERLWPCYVDATKLETAILNLALNGRDAMPDGGVLTIEARNVDVDDGDIAGLAPGSYVSLSVTDTGCGIPPETLDRIFEPFFTTKTVGQGTGLGLSMVYGFVKQSGGDIVVESRVSAGTRVTLYLPKAAPSAPVEAEAVQEKAVPAGSGRILVVEDDDAVLRVTSAMLTQLGYQVQTARNGIEAIQILSGEERFDLLFSDIRMPYGIGGIELAHEARRMRRGIKVVLTSGYAEDVSVRYKARDGFPMVPKPFLKADLARCLWSALHEA